MTVRLYFLIKKLERFDQLPASQCHPQLVGDSLVHRLRVVYSSLPIHHLTTTALPFCHQPFLTTVSFLNYLIIEHLETCLTFELSTIRRRCPLEPRRRSISPTSSRYGAFHLDLACLEIARVSTSLKKPYCPLTVRSFKRGPYITIRYRSQPYSKSIILIESFPKDLSIAFSSIYRKTFPALNKSTTLNISKPKADYVVIEGGDTYFHKEVLK